MQRMNARRGTHKYGLDCTAFARVNKLCSRLACVLCTAIWGAFDVDSSQVPQEIYLDYLCQKQRGAGVLDKTRARCQRPSLVDGATEVHKFSCSGYSSCGKLVGIGCLGGVDIPQQRRGASFVIKFSTKAVSAHRYVYVNSEASMQITGKLVMLPPS